MNAHVKSVLAERRKTALNRAAIDTERAMRLDDFRAVELELRRVRYEIAVNGAPLQETEKELTRKRGDLAARHGLSTEPVYTCPLCRDTGYLPDRKICACARRLATDDFRRRMQLESSPDISFEKTDFSVFGDARSRYEKIYGKMEQFCDRFDTTAVSNILLVGEVGTGKTYLTACVLERMVRDGRAAIFLTAFEFGRACLAHHTSQDHGDVLDSVLDADLLVIDDLGTEPVYRNVTLEYLYSVLNERLRRKKKTILSSNLTQRELFDRYGERIFSRLNNKNTCVTLAFKGDDLRRAGI